MTNPGLTLKRSDVACRTELSKVQKWSKDRYYDSMLNIIHSYIVIHTMSYRLIYVFFGCTSIIPTLETAL